MRDIHQVNGLSCGGVVVVVLLHALVLVRDQGQRQRPERHLRDLRSKAVLHLPLQLHPAVLEPGPDLQRGRRAQNQGNTQQIHGRDSTGASSYLGLCEAESLRRLHPLPSVQVFVFAEDLLQLGDLLRGELGAHPALLRLLLRLIDRGTLGGRRLALVPGGIPTHL